MQLNHKQKGTNKITNSKNEYVVKKLSGRKKTLKKLNVLNVYLNKMVIVFN